MGVPRIYDVGSTGRYNYLSLKTLGPSLSDLVSLCGGKLTVKSMLIIAMQMLKRLEDVHAAGIIHCDIKP